MRLSLGSRSFDLTRRALVMGTVGRAGSAAAVLRDGADIVEVEDLADLEPVVAAGAPGCVAATADAAVEAALAAGAALIRLEAGASAMAYRLCARVGAAIAVGAAAAPAAEAAGIPADRIVVERATPGGRHLVLIDVTGDCPLAATATGVVRGARIVRTGDVRGARRVCDVLAAVWEACP